MKQFVWTFTVMGLVASGTVRADDRAATPDKVPLRVANQTGAKPAGTARPNREELHRQFQTTLSGATLVGHFTTSFDDRPRSDVEESRQAERYTISEVSKLKGDYWLFKARIQYGNTDVTVPLTLPVHWAADTPIITLDDIPVPGMGRFTARVMVFRGHYAGTWAAKDHGGHLFGRIEPPQADEPSSPEGAKE